MRRRLGAVILILAMLLPFSTAMGKQTKKLSINYDQLWSGSIRYLRIDQGFEILDRDKEAGYIIFTFKFPKGKKTSRATMEFIVKGEEQDGKKKVDIQLKIDDGAEYLEIHLLDGLVEKLNKEYDTK
ncbi:MAG: hypothetical protein Kow0090_23100 [Myxococcota bacterium]